MKRSLLVILLIAGLVLQACSVETIYSTLNDRWGLQLPKAVTIIDGASNSGVTLTSSTKDLDYIFQYDSSDQAKLDDLEIWTKLSMRETNQLVKQLHPYFYPGEISPMTPADRLKAVEEVLGFELDETISYYSKRNKQGTTVGKIILLYDPAGVQIRAFHFVE